MSSSDEDDVPLSRRHGAQSNGMADSDDEDQSEDMELELEQDDADDEIGDVEEFEVDEDEADVGNDASSSGSAGMGVASTLVNGNDDGPDLANDDGDDDGEDDDDNDDDNDDNDDDDEDDDDQFELDLDEADNEMGIQPSLTADTDDIYEDDDMSDENDGDSDEDDAPLVKQSNGEKPDVLNHSKEMKASSSNFKHEVSSDEDDDLPLVSRQVAKVQTSASRLRKPANGFLTTEEDEYNSDDDMPLVRHAAGTNGAPKDKRKGKEKVSRAAKSATTKSKLDVKAEVKPSNRKSAGPAQKGAAKAKPRASTKQKISTKDKKAEGVDGPVRKFELPGQRRETPGKAEPLRMFYESMYKERIDLGKPSELAETWMLHHGLLDPKLAAKVYSARIRSR